MPQDEDRDQGQGQGPAQGGTGAEERTAPAEGGTDTHAAVESGAPGGLTAEQLARLRETLIAANPEAVPELIAGADFEALLASVAPARAAYARIREQAMQGAIAGVPRGGGTREPDAARYADLSPEAKIAAALDRT